MASTEDLIKLQFAVLGEQDIKRAKNEIDLLKQTMIETRRSFDQGKISQKEYADGMAYLASQMHRANDTIAATNAAMPKLKSGLAGSGQSMLQLGRVIQDFTQGGIGGILNNIEGMTQALGGPAGLAGVLTIVGVAAFIARPFVEQFISSLGSGPVEKFGTELEKATAKLETMKKSSANTAESVAGIELLEKSIKKMRDHAEAYSRFIQTKIPKGEETGKVGKEFIATLPPRVKHALETPIAQQVLSESVRYQHILAEMKDIDVTLEKLAKEGAGSDILTRRRLVLEREQLETRQKLLVGKDSAVAQQIGKLQEGVEAGDPKAQADMARLLRASGNPAQAKAFEQEIANAKAGLPSAKEVSAQRAKAAFANQQAEIARIRGIVAGAAGVGGVPERGIEGKGLPGAAGQMAGVIAAKKLPLDAEQERVLGLETDKAFKAMDQAAKDRNEQQRLQRTQRLRDLDEQHRQTNRERAGQLGQGFGPFVGASVENAASFGLGRDEAIRIARQNVVNELMQNRGALAKRGIQLSKSDVQEIASMIVQNTMNAANDKLLGMMGEFGGTTHAAQMAQLNLADGMARAMQMQRQAMAEAFARINGIMPMVEEAGRPLMPRR